MQAQISSSGILQLEVESTTEYWAVTEWLKQVTLTYAVLDTSLPPGLVEQKLEKVQAIDPSFIELNWQKIATVSNQ